jgi:hypothetical protein
MEPIMTDCMPRDSRRKALQTEKATVMRTEIKVILRPVSDTPATPSDRHDGCACAILAAKISGYSTVKDVKDEMEDYIMFGARKEAGNTVVG